MGDQQKPVDGEVGHFVVNIANKFNLLFIWKTFAVFEVAIFNSVKFS